MTQRPGTTGPDDEALVAAWDALRAGVDLGLLPDDLTVEDAGANGLAPSVTALGRTVPGDAAADDTAPGELALGDAALGDPALGDPALGGTVMDDPVLLEALALLAIDARRAAHARRSPAFAPPADLAERLFDRSSLAAAARQAEAAQGIRRWTTTGDVSGEHETAGSGSPDDGPRLVGPGAAHPAGSRAVPLRLVEPATSVAATGSAPAVDGQVADVIPLAPRRKRMRRWQAVVASAAAVLAVALVGDAFVEGRLFPVRAPAVLGTGGNSAVDEGGQGGDIGGADGAAAPAVDDDASSTEAEGATRRDGEAGDEPTNLEELLERGPVPSPAPGPPAPGTGGGPRPGVPGPTTPPVSPPTGVEGDPDTSVPAPTTPAAPEPSGEPAPTQGPSNPPTDAPAPPGPEPTPDPTPPPAPTTPPDPTPDPTTPPVVVTVIAESDVASTPQGVATSIAVGANDTVEGGEASLAVTSQPAAGTAERVDIGRVRYTPQGGFVGTDRFTYTLCVGAVCDAAQVTVEVVATGSAPVASPDSAEVAAGGTGSIAVLANDWDADGDIDRSSLAIVAQPAAGAAEVADGRIRYVAPAEATTVVIGYRICDVGGRCATSQATVTVLPAEPVEEEAPAPEPLGVAGPLQADVEPALAVQPQAVQPQAVP